jgi:hypothetical protein
MDSQYVVEPFRASDAEGVSRLFAEVYGDRYPIRMVYHPGELIAAVEGGRYFPFCVHDGPGEVIGFGALYPSAPFQGIYEFVQGMVSPNCQGGGIGRLLFEFVERYIPTLPGCETYFGEAVCNHIHTQKTGAMIKTIETGIEVDLIPGDLYGEKWAGPERVAAVDMFRTFVPKPQTVHIPAVYDEIARYIYDGFDDDRTILPSNETGPRPDGQTEMSLGVIEYAQVARIYVPVVGADFFDRLDEEERALSGRGMRAVQVWLGISRPGVDGIVEGLRARGYFFGALCPRWFNDDAILMQRVNGPPDWENIRLYSARAQRILAFVRNDWDDVTKGKG